eukprot:3466509-Pyramimonas_sp.AAC.1
MHGSPTQSMHTPRGMTPLGTSPAQSPFGTPVRPAANGALMERIAAARADHSTALQRAVL